MWLMTGAKQPTRCEIEGESEEETQRDETGENEIWEDEAGEDVLEQRRSMEAITQHPDGRFIFF